MTDICRVCKNDVSSDDHLKNAAWCYLALHYAIDKIKEIQGILPEFKMTWEPKKEQKK